MPSEEQHPLEGETMSSGQTSGKRKLSLRKQTLRALTARQLAQVAGGTGYFDPGDGDSYYDDTSQTQGPGAYSGPTNCGCC
jgi:hypothetical protein